LDVYAIEDVEGPSKHRRVASQMAPPQMAPGPDADPEGWSIFPSATFLGTLFKHLNVEIHCTVKSFGYLIQLSCDNNTQVAFSTPLSYQPGDIIPIRLTLRASGDVDSRSQVLDILSKHPAVLICLSRRVTTKKKGKEKRRSWKGILGTSGEPYSMGVCWPCSASCERDIRVLNCEIRVPDDAVARFAFGDLAVEVSLVSLLLDRSH
jgi:hypothetical protein